MFILSLTLLMSGLAVTSGQSHKQIEDLRFGYPLEPLIFGQDAEDEPGAHGERDFYGGSESIVFRLMDVETNQQGEVVSGKVVASHPEEIWEERIIAPPDGKWLVQHSWKVPGQPVIVLQSGSTASGQMVFFHTDGMKELATIPYRENTSPTDDWGFATTPVAIEPERLYFQEKIPEALRPYFPKEAAIVENVVWWRDYAHDPERESIENWHHWLSQYLATLTEQSDRKQVDPEGLDVARAALESNEPLPSQEKIAGVWKLRSIQGGPNSVVVYPWFEGVIVVTDRPQELAFGKRGGSQFRSGKLLPDGSDRSMVFLGGQFTEFDGDRIYSTLDDTIDAPRKRSDSGGVFFFLAPGHAVMVLDVTPEHWEIYEMRRQGYDNL